MLNKVVLGKLEHLAEKHFLDEVAFATSAFAKN